MIDKLDILEPKQRAQINIEISAIMEDIRKGRLEIIQGDKGDKGVEIKQYISNGETFTYKTVDAGANIARKKHDDEHDQILAILGYLCGEGSEIMKKLKPEDMAIAKRIGSFLYNTV
jgi:hypothetical protein